MKRFVLALALAALATPALAAPTRTYQVTGPVLDVTADTITVQKGSEKWEIARTADTKVTGELKKGEKVTVEYRMTAATIEVKAAKK
jgi:RNase P/RNase MRP subunit p29